MRVHEPSGCEPVEDLLARAETDAWAEVLLASYQEAIDYELGPLQMMVAEKIQRARRN